MKPQVLTISRSADLGSLARTAAAGQQQLLHRLGVDRVLGAAERDDQEAARRSRSERAQSTLPTQLDGVGDRLRVLVGAVHRDVDGRSIAGAHDDRGLSQRQLAVGPRGKRFGDNLFAVNGCFDVDACVGTKLYQYAVDRLASAKGWLGGRLQRRARRGERTGNEVGKRAPMGVGVPRRACWRSAASD